MSTIHTDGCVAYFGNALLPFMGTVTSGKAFATFVANIQVQKMFIQVDPRVLCSPYFPFLHKNPKLFEFVHLLDKTHRHWLIGY